MIELCNTKTQSAGRAANGREKFILDSSIGALVMREKGATGWIDIDPELDDNGLPKAVPYDVTVLDGLPGFHVRSKVDGGEWHVQLKEGRDGDSVKITHDSKVKREVKSDRHVWKDIYPDVDIELVFSNTAVTLQRIIKSDKAPIEYDMDILEVVKGADCGVMPLTPAVDADGKLVQMVETKLDTGRTETLTKNILSVDGSIDNPVSVKYPILDSTTIDVQVGASADDGNSYGTTFNSTSTSYSVGRYTTSYYSVWSRFTGITIVKGSTINVAYYTTYHTLIAGTVLTALFADDQNDPTAPTSRADHVARTRTSAKTDWDGDPGAVGNWYNSPSIVGVIQELVTSYGYSNQAIQILWDDDGSASTGYRQSRSWDSTVNPTHTWGPKLHIEYTAGGGGDTFSYLPLGAFRR